MTPQELLARNDSGELWPAHGGRATFTDLASAYGSALAVRDLRLARGEKARGFKVGFTNRNIWPRYQVFAPIWGTVWDTTLSFSEGDAPISLAHTCQPRIEPEVVFGLKATPRADACLQDLFDALEWVAPGFEIVQSHLPGWKFNAAQTVADGALHARLRVGSKVPVLALASDAERLDAVLAGVRIGLHRGDALVEEGVGANVLDSPLRALLYFLNELRRYPGAPDLAPGDVVTTGTLTDAWPVEAGQRWSARFDSALPTLTVAFR